jgi:hypothetical protein
MAFRGTQAGALSSMFFWKKTWPGSSGVPTPCTQRLRVTGRWPAWWMTCGATAA